MKKHLGTLPTKWFPIDTISFGEVVWVRTAQGLLRTAIAVEGRSKLIKRGGIVRMSMMWKVDVFVLEKAGHISGVEWAPFQKLSAATQARINQRQFGRVLRNKLAA